MGLFKWWVHLGDQYGPFFADGYVYAESIEDAEDKIAQHYNNEYHCVVIDKDWNFFTDTDIRKDVCEKAKQCYKKQFDDGVIVRWED